VIVFEPETVTEDDSVVVTWDDEIGKCTEGPMLMPLRIGGGLGVGGIGGINIGRQGLAAAASVGVLWPEEHAVSRHTAIAVRTVSLPTDQS
jgi:hypothetical protein